MKLSNYIGKKIRIELTNSFRYQGKIISTDENSITLIDKFGNEVTLSNASILFIAEVKNA